MTRLSSFLLAVVLALGCARESTDLVKEVAAEAKAKARVVVSVKLAGEQQSPDEAALQKRIEDAVENQNIGRLVSSSTAAGVMTVTVEVQNTADAIEKLRKVLKENDALSRSSFRVETTAS